MIELIPQVEPLCRAVLHNALDLIGLLANG